jgi:hypothetical protein
LPPAGCRLAMSLPRCCALPERDSRIRDPHCQTDPPGQDERSRANWPDLDTAAMDPGGRRGDAEGGREGSRREDVDRGRAGVTAAACGWEASGCGVLCACVCFFIVGLGKKEFLAGLMGFSCGFCFQTSYAIFFFSFYLVATHHAFVPGTSFRNTWNTFQLCWEHTE